MKCLTRIEESKAYQMLLSGAISGLCMALLVVLAILLWNFCWFIGGVFNLIGNQPIMTVILALVFSSFIAGALLGYAD